MQWQLHLPRVISLLTQWVIQKRFHSPPVPGSPNRRHSTPRLPALTGTSLTCSQLLLEAQAALPRLALALTPVSSSCPSPSPRITLCWFLPAQPHVASQTPACALCLLPIPCQPIPQPFPAWGCFRGRRSFKGRWWHPHHLTVPAQTAFREAELSHLAADPRNEGYTTLTTYEGLTSGVERASCLTVHITAWENERRIIYSKWICVLGWCNVVTHPGIRPMPVITVSIASIIWATPVPPSTDSCCVE